MTKPIALIVEDDPQLSQIFAITLEPDFDVEVITEGDAAITRLDRPPAPRVVILDLNLPAVSGSEILSHIRADERLKDIVVMLATADARQADALQDKADYVLLKPISPMQLRQLASRIK